MSIEKDQVKFLAIIGCLFLLFGAAIWLPAYFQRQSLDNRIITAQQTLGIMPSQEESLSSWYTQVVDLRQRINQAQRYVPAEDELAQVLRGLTTAMQTQGITRPEMTTQEVRHYANYSLIPVNVRFTGDFPAIYRVLKSIEEMPRLIRIEQLIIEGNPTSTMQPLNVNMRLSTFFSKKHASSNQENK